MHGWIVTTHDEVREILRDKEFWSDPRKADPDSAIARFQLAGDQEPSMLFLDDPDHRRLRSLVNKAFTPKAVEAMRPRIAAIANELLDAIERRRVRSDGPRRRAVAGDRHRRNARHRHAPTGRFQSLVERRRLRVLQRDAQRRRSRNRSDAQAALDACFRKAIAECRAAPGQDLISAMVQATEGGDSMNDDEIVMQCNLLLIAGNVTTTDLIGNGVRALLENPNELAKLRARPDLLENAVEEMLRFDSPVISSGRIANRNGRSSRLPDAPQTIDWRFARGRQPRSIGVSRAGSFRHRTRRHAPSIVRRRTPFLPRRAAGARRSSGNDPRAIEPVSGLAARYR